MIVTKQMIHYMEKMEYRNIGDYYKVGYGIEKEYRTRSYIYMCEFPLVVRKCIVRRIQSYTYTHEVFTSRFWSRGSQGRLKNTGHGGMTHSRAFKMNYRK